MGLDIYLKLAKKTRERNKGEHLSHYIDELEKAECERCFAIYKETVKNALKEMRKVEKKWKTDFPNCGEFPMGNLWPQLNEFDWEMRKYFKYDFQREPIKKANSIKEIGDWAKSMEKGFYKPSTVYFRKVNCIYRYFEKRLVDEECLVTKKDVIDIIKKATKVLEAKDETVSAELLPTRSGFFFGSTEYGEWYYNDMVEILSEFGKLLKEWEDDDICYVQMSW